MPSSWRELTNRLRDGDDTAFNELYLMLYPRLVRLATVIVHTQSVAEELVQETFLTLWDRRSTVRDIDHIESYLYTTVRNHALGILRHQRIIARMEGQYTGIHDAPPGMGASESDIDAVFEEAERSRAIEQVFRELPEVQRMVVVLRWQEQLTYQQIAVRLGLSVKGVRIQLDRAYRTLRARLGRLVR
jgi:RNA polymerase sigma-70 factor (ECF subfamily)